MAATLAEIHGWFDEGKAQESTHMLVICDSYDHEDYPVYAHSKEEAQSEFEKYNNKNMQKVMEVYDLRKPFHTQTRGRAMNF